MAQVTQNSAQLTAGAWAGDYAGPEHLVPGGAQLDASQFLATDGVLVTLSADALAAAESISVDALPGPIPSGTLLNFGVGKYARTTANAAAAATSIAVEALPAGLTDGDTATYAGGGTKKKTIASGTLVGRTYAERDAGDGYGPADSADDQIFLIAFGVDDADANPDIVLYRHGSIVYEDYLPDWATMGATLQGVVRDLYTCMTKG